MRDVLTFTAFLAVPATMAVLGCSSSPGLTVTGDVTIDASGAITGFAFEEPARLDGAAPNGAITGTCSLTSDPSRSTYGVVVDLFAPNQGEGRSLRSITIMSRTDAPQSGTVEADLGPESFRGTCTVDVPFVNGNGQVTVHTEGCAIASGDETASVDLDLTFDRCTVMVD